MIWNNLTYHYIYNTEETFLQNSERSAAELLENPIFFVATIVSSLWVRYEQTMYDHCMTIVQALKWLKVE